jgi:hypothetical protein
VRTFAARYNPSSTLAAFGAALRALYTVPDSLPENFVKAFARLESSEEHQKQHETSVPRNPARLVAP